MKTSAIIRIVVWTLIALMLVGVLLIGLGGYGLYSLGSWHSSEDGGNYQLGGGSVNASDIRSIEIDWIAGGVDVVPSEGSEIVFDETSRYKLDESDRMHYDVSGGKLTINHSRRREHWFGIRRALEKNLTVKLPRSLYGKLDALEVSNVSALVSIDGVGARDIAIDTVSGAVRLNDITCDELDISAVSGGTTGDKVTARKVDSESVSGRRVISGSMEELNIDGVSGGVEIVSDKCPDKINVDTISGGVSITIPENDGFTVKYDKVSGSVDSDFEVTTDKNLITYKNGGARFDVTTISGSVKIGKG